MDDDIARMLTAHEYVYSWVRSLYEGMRGDVTLRQIAHAMLSVSDHDMPISRLGLMLIRADGGINIDQDKWSDFFDQFGALVQADD